MPFENWEEDNGLISRLKQNPKKFLVIFLVGILACASVGFGLMRIWSPESEPVTVSGIPELSQPAFNATSLYIGETLQITVKLTDAYGAPMEGEQVWFQENKAEIGSAYTNSEGDAIFNRAVTTQGTYVYNCSAML